MKRFTKGFAPETLHPQANMCSQSSQQGQEAWASGCVKEEDGAGWGGRGSSTVKRRREGPSLRVISHHYIVKCSLACGSVEGQSLQGYACVHMLAQRLHPAFLGVKTSHSHSQNWGASFSQQLCLLVQDPHKIGPFSIPSWRGEGLTRPNPSSTVAVTVHWEREIFFCAVAPK